jgi:hypothetical protein
MLIDGHARRDEVDDDFEMPVLITDLTDEEADLHLTVADPIAGMASTDTAALSSLLDEAKPSNDAVAVLLARLAEEVTARDERTVTPPDAFPGVDPDEMDLAHTCPRCGFEWDVP